MEASSIARSGRLAPLVAVMFLGGVAMWVGAPVLWLWVGSLVKVSTDSLGLAVIVMMPGAVATIAAVVRVLMWANETYRERYEAISGDQPEHTPLEPMLVVSAGIAIAAFCVWFFLFSGASPTPISIGV